MEAADAGNGIVQLLLDHQMSPADEALFVHDARKLTNAAGVQRGSQLSFGWDPSYQTLTLHFVSVLRGGKRIDALRRADVKVLERETEMDWHLYDGSLTALLVLKDVRPGDVVDYAYSLHGENPILGGRYFDGLGMRGSVPYAEVRYRLLWPPGRALFTKAHGEVPDPVVTPQGAFTEYLWEAKNVPALLADSDLPSWFDPYPWVQISELASWRDVARWAVPLYELATPGEAVRAEARRIEAAGATPRDRVAAALRFVQEEIRYLGLEMGTGSYRPNPPRDVLARRFGDCKDKALLFVALLGELGVEARPALVHTEERQGLERWHPSPVAFNHVIVRVILEGKELWLDPTRTRQGGALEEIWLPPFRRALIVDSSTEGLATIPEHPGRGPWVSVAETWTVPAFDAAASFVVTTTRRGLAADAARVNFAETSRDVIEKGSLEFYTERYPGISQEAPIETTDDLAANVFVVRESYSVKGLFAAEDGKRLLKASFYPQEIRNALPDPGSRQRTMPLALPYPDHLVHEAVVHLPTDWTMPVHDETVATSAFRFVSQASSAGREVRFRYEWNALRDAIAVAEAGPALAKISKIVDGLGWELTYDPDAPVAQPTSAWADLNLPVIAATLLLLVLCAAAAVKLAKWQLTTPPLPPSPSDESLVGLGGWLALFGFGCVVRPVVILVQVATSHAPTVFRSSAWSALTSPGGASYHPVWAPLLLGELFVNVALFVLSLLLVVVFFQKKRVFPPLAIATLTAMFVLSVADNAAAQFLPASVRPASAAATTEVGRAAIQGFLWIPYFVRSRRVRATFVN